MPYASQQAATTASSSLAAETVEALFAGLADAEHDYMQWYSNGKFPCNPKKERKGNDAW